MTILQRDPASYTDPSGYVYWEGDRVLRRIYAEKAPFFREVLANPAVTALMHQGTLVGTEVASSDDAGLSLAHETLWPRSYPQEWCAPMLRDAGMAILEVAETLAASDLALADGHPWNVLFRHTRPVFIDVGSIEAPHAALPWPALAQFNRFVRYPLHLYAAGLGELARARLADLALGVSADLAARALPTGYRLRHPVVAAKLAANRAAERLADRAPQGASTSAMRPVDPRTLKAIRQPFFGGLRRELDAIRLESAGAWVSYYASCPSMGEADAAAKAEAMGRVLATLKPATVLDLGANTGQYAKLAARAGARVIALDQDEASIAALYHEARREGLDILPLVMDLGNPTPATGWCAAQRPDALSRFRSDTAYMLALIHHLVFTGNASLAQVAQLAGRAADRHAVIEWVAPDDPMVLHLRRTATKDFGFYTKENLIAALEAEGFAVEAIAPHSTTRQLLVGTRR